MNNKGFGLPEVLVFIGISMFILVVTTIYCNTHDIFNGNYIEEENIVKQEEVESTDIDIVPNKQVIPTEYTKLEEQLKKSAYDYNFDKKETIIISSKKLNIDLIDPIDNTIECSGYVVYKSNNNTYTPYINCPGMYVTENYNSELE